MYAIQIPLTDVDRRLIDAYQREFPLEDRPFARIATELGILEDEVLERLAHLRRFGVLSRVGPVLKPNRIGASTLAALAVPPSDLERVARIVNGYSEVNHNYEREHEYNLWFVVTASDRDRVDAVLADIGRRTGLTPLDLPMVEDYFIDLGFALQWT